MKRFGFQLKNKFFNMFREIFVHHYSSLDFRAKIFALIIAANDKPKLDNFILVKTLATDIYPNDPDRANMLLLSTKEFIDKINSKKLSVDTLVQSITNNVKLVPRYAKKIDIENLSQFLNYAEDEDAYAYQENILEFLEKLKKETLEK